MPPKVFFNDNTVHNIIESVKEYPQLWNQEHEHYKSRFHCAVAWKSIAETLELPENLIRIKWKNLRDTYKKELKKYKVTNDGVYTGKWVFFEPMTFTNIQLDEDDEDKRDENFEFVMADDFDDSNNEQKVLYDKISNTQDENAAQRTVKENYDVLFLRSLVPYFKELDPMRKLVMRNKIQELLLTELAINNANNKRKT